ncbi:hypothetical protein L226DRAFT_355213 [Lentinus tigrinus ALCF2SS1-7]|uniref:uncharacterized protein n=1 Tax=Lentinus tigrinus ALCF2SS1-7 TaxID=1328758 RepID=UPI001165E608|nr:hypothetical protein L226DRAFT_355213 [Lentinus tigrinus ALCF2SS1-7]
MVEFLDVTTPSSSASRVLMNVDILLDMFDIHSFQKGDLARCARVCRAFSGPALRALWHVLFSIRPVWHLLAPSDLPYVPEYPEDSEMILEEYWKAREEYYPAILAAGMYRDTARRERYLTYISYVRVLHEFNPFADLRLFSVLHEGFPIPPSSHLYANFAGLFVNWMIHKSLMGLNSRYFSPPTWRF